MEATETRKAKLIFNPGKYKNKKPGIEKDVYISKLDGKIVYADMKLFNIKTRVSYDCELKSSPEGRAYDVISAVKTPAIKANLEFERGEKKYNEKTNDSVQNMISTFKGIRVIAPESLNVEPQKEYSVEMVLSPNGRAYIVESAESALPAKAEIIAHESPLSIVEVIIDGIHQDDLRFDCMAGDERMLQDKIRNLQQKNIADKGMIIYNYEAACRDLMQKHLSKIQ